MQNTLTNSLSQVNGELLHEIHELRKELDRQQQLLDGAEEAAE